MIKSDNFPTNFGVPAVPNVIGIQYTFGSITSCKSYPTTAHCLANILALHSRIPSEFILDGPKILNNPSWLSFREQTMDY